jgi:hypothetical protein
VSERFEELSRSLAGPVPRRRALKTFGIALGGAVAATVVKPFRSDALVACTGATAGPSTNGVCPAGTTPCGPCCCNAGIACLDRTSGACGCPSGQSKCGGGCCSGTCADPSTNCCCASGTTPCGPACCQKGVACVDRTTGMCGCPSGTTPCGKGGVLTCCPAGQACGPNSSSCPPPNTTVKRCGCTQTAVSCTSDAQCCSGFCGPSKSGGACGCRNDSECPSGFFCYTPEAFCVRGCGSSADCPPGWSCDSGLCFF